MTAALRDKRKLGTIVRKVLHLIFTIPLLLPFIAPSLIHLDPVAYYSLLTLIVGFVYVAYTKKHRLYIQFRDRIDLIRAQLNKITLAGHYSPATRTISIPLEHIQSALMKVEAKLREIIELAEREYERRYGYIGVLMGSLGVLCSYLLFRRYALYGILGLAVYDTVSAVAGILIGKRRIPLTEHTVEGCLAAVLAFFTVLVAVGVSPIHALALALTAMVAELLGIEDNLAIPLATSAVAYLLGSS